MLYEMRKLDIYKSFFLSILCFYNYIGGMALQANYEKSVITTSSK
jgi:hypothetical protein